MNEYELNSLAEEGKSIQELATHFGKSKTAIRHWLTKYNIVTKGKAGNKAADLSSGTKHCNKCDRHKPLIEFGVRNGRANAITSYCLSCMAKEVKERSHNSKQFYVNALGDICSRCKESYIASQYDFHHIEPEHKDFTIRQHKLATPTKIATELAKCILLCANCHKHTHNEMKQHDGYHNKIKGNTESYQDNKLNKLEFVGKHSCECCQYDAHIGSLAFVFSEKDKQHKTNNTRIWSEEYKTALLNATVLCLNCVRLIP